MRKRYKIKKRACGLCKPHKQGWQHSMKEPDLLRLKEVEREILNVKMQPV